MFAKKIKHILLSAILTISCFAAVIYTSGCKNKCGNTTCYNGGTCVNNICSCPSGYYGNGCQNSWSSPYVGTYVCRKSCVPSVVSGSWQSSITVASTNGGYTVYISNFGGSPSITAYATVDSVNSLTNVGNITIPPAVDSGLAGSGRIYVTTHDSIIINYTSSVKGVSSGFTCSMTMIKQ